MRMRYGDLSGEEVDGSDDHCRDSGVIALRHEHLGTKRYGMMRLVGVRSEPTAQGGNGPSCRHAWAKHRQEILRSESLRLTVLSEAGLQRTDHLAQDLGGDVSVEGGRLQAIARGQ